LKPCDIAITYFPIRLKTFLLALLLPVSCFRSCFVGFDLIDGFHDISSSPFGLASGLFGSDLRRSFCFARSDSNESLLACVDDCVADTIFIAGFFDLRGRLAGLATGSLSSELDELDELEDSSSESKAGRVYIRKLVKDIPI
jgi:hypothetical protein